MRVRKLLVVSAVAVVLGAGAAYAVWSSTGTGSATAQSTTSVDSEIASGVSAADLYPGAVGKSVTVTVTNPNPFPVVVNSISAGSSALVNGSCVAGTVTSDARPIEVTGLLQSNGSTTQIAAGGSGTYRLDTHMLTTAAETCKLQTFSLALTATLSSAA